MLERFVKAMGLALALGWMALPAAAQVRGTISGPAHRAFPIVVSPLAGGGDEARAFDTTLRRDLEISGLFRVLAVPGSAAPDTQGRVDYERWSAMRTRFLVAGTYQPYGEGFTLDVRLYDVIERRILGGKRYEAPRQELARMANRFADEILRILTGRRGPFDSEITFVSSTGGGFKEVWVMRFDGGDLRQLTRNQTINLSPTWAPGARSILYTSYRDGRPGLYEVDVRTQRRRRIQGGAGLVVGGRFSPDGRRIAVAREESGGNTEIVLLDPSGRKQAVVAADAAVDVSPAWSPDGRSLAFCSSRGGTPQIYITDLEGGGARRVTTQGNYNTSPAWSPDGGRLAYVGRVAGGTFQIFVVDLASGATRQVTSPPGDNTGPSWSPDGRYLVFSSSRAGRDELFVTDWRGLRHHRLIGAPGGDTSPAWSPWID
jgi:TolB protein